MKWCFARDQITHCLYLLSSKESPQRWWVNRPVRAILPLLFQEMKLWPSKVSFDFRLHEVQVVSLGRPKLLSKWHKSRRLENKAKFSQLQNTPSMAAEVSSLNQSEFLIFLCHLIPRFLIASFIQINVSEGEKVEYTLQTRKPNNIRGRTYVVSAFINVGWISTMDSDWIREGDFVSSGIVVNLQNGEREYEANMDFSSYGECQHHLNTTTNLIFIYILFCQIPWSLFSHSYHLDQVLEIIWLARLVSNPKHISCILPDAPI